MANSFQRTIYTGTFIWSKTLDELEIREHLAVGVDEDGIIRHIVNLPWENDLVVE